MNLKFEYSPSSAYKEKLNLLFATLQYPDVIEFVDTVTINRFARDGFMLPISDYIDKLPNYKNAFTPEDWDKQVKLLSNARGKWFALEIKWPESAMGTNVWMYRIKEFEKQGISLPKTTDDLYQAMKQFKEVNPNATIPNRWGVWNAIEGFNMAFRVQTDIWLDPDVKDIVYGPATEKYRNLMKYMNCLFKEGILAKEFATMTGEQRTAEFTNGNVHVNYQFPGAENALNEWLKSNNLEPDWAWSKDALLLTAYPDKKPTQQRYKITTDFGTAITDKLSGEELDRYISFLNWAASEEGQIFYEFGIKGVTYDIIDGRPQYIGKAKDEMDPDSYLGNIESFGPFGYYLIQNEAHAKICYPLYHEINECTKGMEYYDYTPLAYRYTPEEEDIVADAGTVVNDVRDEYMLKFIMGNKDPNNDNDWNEYNVEALVISGQILTVKEVIEKVKKDIPYYEISGGRVTFSGGEPLLQVEFLKKLLMECKRQNIHTTVDTAGNVKWDIFEEILPYTDLFLYDIKCMDSNKHKEATGKGNMQILENLKLLENSSKDIWIRIPVIPGINDNEEEMKQIADFIEELKGINRVDILPFNRFGKEKYESLNMEYKVEKYPPLPEKLLDRLMNIFLERRFDTRLYI